MDTIKVLLNDIRAKVDEIEGTAKQFYDLDIGPATDVAFNIQTIRGACRRLERVFKKADTL